MHESHTIAKAKFRTFRNDPIGVKEYTLSNGLKLFLSVNKDEPRIYTEIAVRAGSKHDPADTTGLAHYFEHMMFKGTDRLGSLDWSKEKVILDKIELLFEQHRAEKDPEIKREMYAEIDRLSFEAAKLAAANEYDKMVSALGATHTNAYTWVEQTVYVNDIPSNEIKRWFELEAERFRRPVLRLFHTELETVFEEYNISQDKDFRKTLKAMQAMLTPSHPYGTQTTLGRGEDLKNPSQTNIYRFFDQYYIPNNIGIVLCGDFDPEEAVQLAEKNFGGFAKKKKPAFHFEPQPEIQGRIQQDVYGNEAPWVEIGWRIDGAQSADAMLLPVVAAVLHNGHAGLMDEHLVQNQQLLEAHAYPRMYEDYGGFYCYGKPRDGQSHEDVEALLMQEVARLRAGDFPDWLPEAVVKNLKLTEAKGFEKNEGRASAITGAFVLGLDWSDMTKRWKEWENITSQDIIAFAKRLLRDDNRAVLYKHTGADDAVIKVDKPPITAVELNRVDSSVFATDFLSGSTPDIEPQFIDFKKVIKKTRISPTVKLRAVPEPKRPIFRLDYCFDMGKTADRRLGLLESYLPFLGTSQYSATHLQQQFFRLGVHCFASCREEHFYLSLSGLPESFEAAVELMEHLIADAQPNVPAMQNLVSDILVRRENYKKDKRIILTKGMLNYARYGSDSPFNYRFSKEELLATDPKSLTDLLRDLRGFQHEVYYTGPNALSKVKKVLKEKHYTPAISQKVLPGRKFKELTTTNNKVYFVNFPMVQTELMMFSKGTAKFNLEEYLFSQWYNQYFGYGLSSIVYQDIREARALAYSAYAYASVPAKKDRSHFLQAYVGTQPDKLHEAVNAFRSILEDMPASGNQMDQARTSVLKQIAAERITPAELYWTWRGNRDKGYETDLREKVYGHLQAAGNDDLINYQKAFIKGRQYTWLVLGERERIDFKFLKTIGKVTELTLEQVFGEL
jgi:predicted Zn-dependent peptidase